MGDESVQGWIGCPNQRSMITLARRTSRRPTLKAVGQRAEKVILKSQFRREFRSYTPEGAGSWPSTVTYCLNPGTLIR